MRAKVRKLVSGANAIRCRGSGEEWLKPVPLQFQDLDAAETFEVQEVTVEDDNVATVTLVVGKADNLGAEANGWAVSMSGLFCTYNSK